MSNLITRVTEFAMTVTLAYVSSGDTVVDATCGSGQDTLVLSRAVGDTGKVYAFDIQRKAVLLTETRLKSHGCGNVHIAMKSFASMSEHIAPGTASVVVFNLGYLPGGDHSVTTTAAETLRGLDAALDTIRTGGIITVVMYDGHEAGKEEKKRILKWAEDLDPQRYHASYVSLINQSNDPPEILWVTKKR